MVRLQISHWHSNDIHNASANLLLSIFIYFSRHLLNCSRVEIGLELFHDGINVCCAHLAPIDSNGKG